MKLLVINASPKKSKNNTGIMLESFISGFLENKKNSVHLHRLNSPQSLTESLALFEQEDFVLLAFPLYSYSMPAQVKLFIESLETYRGKCQQKTIFFLVQYGFTEAIHARPLEKYHKHLCQILGCRYGETIIKGGCDGLTRGQAPVKKILGGINAIGRHLGESGVLDKEELKRYSAPEIGKKKLVWFMKIVVWAINKLYWQKMMKKNGVSVSESFAKPYLKGDPSTYKKV